MCSAYVISYGYKIFIGNDNYQRYLSSLSNLTFKMSLLVSVFVLHKCSVYLYGCLFQNVCVDVSVIYRYPSSKSYIMCMHKMLTKRRHTSGVEHAKQKPTTTTTNVDEWVNLKIRLFPWLDIQSCLFTSFVGSSIVEIICYPSNLLQYLEKYYIY